MKNCMIMYSIEKCGKYQFVIYKYSMASDGKDHDEGIVKIVCACCGHEYNDFYYNEN